MSCWTVRPAIDAAASAPDGFAILREAVRDDAAEHRRFNELLRSDQLTRSIADLLITADERSSESSSYKGSSVLQSMKRPSSSALPPGAVVFTTAYATAADESLIQAVIDRRKQVTK